MFIDIILEDMAIRNVVFQTKENAYPVEYALRRPDLGDPFRNYLHTLF